MSDKLDKLLTIVEITSPLTSGDRTICRLVTSGECAAFNLCETWSVQRCDQNNKSTDRIDKAVVADSEDVQ